MRILYGVVGEGMGHAVRSGVVLSHLLDRGHEVEVMASGRAVEYLRRMHEAVRPIHGFHMISEDNRIRRWKTLASNIGASLEGVPRNVKAYFKLISDFAPDAVISDFESWTYLFAKNHRLPVISIDNMQVINRCRLPEQVVRGHEKDLDLAKAVVKAKLPFCRHYFVTSFFKPEVRKERTTLCPPILRQQVLDARSTEGEHLLVYQTAEGNDELLRALEATGRPCRIYGMRRDLRQPQHEGRLSFMPFSEDGFLSDLSSAQGVIASAGFTLMGEAVYLRKPMLAVPLKRQFEQILNANYLAHEGYGQVALDLEQPSIIDSFLEALPDYRRALGAYSQDGNRELFSALDRELSALGAD